MTKPLFHYPYEDTPEEFVSRLNVRLSTEDLNAVRLCRLQQGTIQNTASLLWKKLVNELKRRGITDITKRNAFEDFVGRCILVLPEDVHGKPTPESLPKASGRDDEPGITGSHPGVKGETDVCADVPRVSGGAKPKNGKGGKSRV